MKYLTPLVHSTKYIAFLQQNQPKNYERPVTLAGQLPCGGRGSGVRSDVGVTSG